MIIDQPPPTSNQSDASPTLLERDQPLIPEVLFPTVPDINRADLRLSPSASEFVPGERLLASINQAFLDPTVSFDPTVRPEAPILPRLRPNIASRSRLVRPSKLMPRSGEKERDSKRRKR